MRAAARMRLRTGVARNLSVETYPTIDATLEQFNIPTNDGWAGERYDYVLTMCGSANDSDLLEIADYLELDTGIVVPEADQEQLWGSDGIRVFLSHLSVQRQFCGDLKEHLSSLGIRCFVAHDAIDPDELWQREIEKALVTSDALVAILTEGFKESDWTDQEIGWAKGRGIPVYGVRMGLDPYGFMGERQGITVRDEGELGTIATLIFNALKRREENKVKMLKGLICELSTSHNFYRSNELAELISDLNYWDPSLNEFFLNAFNENNQVSGATSVTNLLRVPFEQSGGQWPVK
jgi:nucleoside 2-deoxyribosyltransferase